MDTCFFPTLLKGVTAAPPSKSEAHRRLICAGLTEGVTTLKGYMPSDDMRATLHCLNALGSSASQEGSELTVRGFDHQPEALPAYDCGESGSTLRFFVPIALAKTGGGIFRMHGRLGQRPMDVYRDLFVPAGVTWRMGEGPDDAAELTVTGSLTSGGYRLPGSVSSQFVSGMLFTLPMLEGDSVLTVVPPVESASYIRMTVAALKQSGIRLAEEAPFTWNIPGGQTYRATSGTLEGDWSQAAVFLCADALGAQVTVTGLYENSAQGDKLVLRCLEALGATVRRTEDGLTVEPGQRHGATLNLVDNPDIAPILALVCQLSEGESRLTHLHRLRIKESDRLTATVDMLNQLGGDAREENGDIVIHGVSRLKGGVTVDAQHDHRMVMLAAIAALYCEEPVTVQDTDALNKSWPGFLDTYRALGGRAE